MRLGPMLIIVAIAFLMMATARADDKTPLDEAKMLAIKAADLIVAKGVDDARSAFHQDGEWKQVASPAPVACALAGAARGMAASVRAARRGSARMTADRSQPVT